MIQIDLTGKRALICGASQGIGEATALMFAKAGASVVLLARSEDKLAALVKKLEQLNPNQKHQFICLDLSSTAEIEIQISALLKSGPIHILVHNSGGPKGGALIDALPEDFFQAFQNHIGSAQTLAKLLVPGMKTEKFGRIINVISTSVKVPIPNLGVSNTIRGAMASWAKTLANEVGSYGITVNNILPGFTVTPRLESLRKATAEKMKIAESDVEKNWLATIPAARFAKPEETASAISFLASPLAGYINGINLPVDGGRTPSL